MSARDALRRTLVIALAETQRTRGSFNRKTTITLLAIALATAVLLPALVDDGLDFDRGLYRVAVGAGSPLEPAVAGAHVFQRFASDDPRGAVDAGAADLGIEHGRIYAKDTQKGLAALAALRQAAKDYTYGQLLHESDHAAAFPVRVELLYEPQARSPDANLPRTMPGGIAPREDPSAGGGSTGTVSGGASGGASGPTQQAPAGGFEFLPAERSVNTPETLSPPFPFRSLLLAYAFLIPMNFVVQVYAGSAIAERLDRKGEPLLASPARPWEIIVGKAAPYMLLMMLASAGIVLAIGGGWLSLLAVAPLALAFLALEFIAAMYARSFRELTFLTVFTSVLLTIYAFLPAVFTDVHPISLVSPITLVVFDLRGDAVTLGQMLYATLPLTFFSLVLFVLGAALYREEDLFHQKPVLAKAVDSVARQIRSMASAVKLPFLLLPLVFIAELMLVTFLFAWPVPVGTLSILAGVALVEETFKAAPSYAGVRRGVVPLKRAALFGALVGLGFFLAEKGFLLASLAGLMDVNAGAAVFGPAGAGATAGASLGLVLLLLLAPMLLHMGTASLTGWGAQHGGKVFAASFLLAVVVHTAYNLAALRWMGASL
ncbi:MAG TPA: PrsW family intramembrane metalloprotease [Candidatus Thermoplasmatota archaeon]|nr:PrsW family intramembrane metalloprotease [Candidatus Thermoplasmatota archaeon]